MATVEQFLACVRSHIGVTESPPGSNDTPFAARAGHLNGQPWCATFVVACARDAGVKLPSESAYTPTMADGFKHAGRWTPDDPRPGDLAFVDFPDDHTVRIQHVAVVVGVDENRVRTIEGNTSSGEAGSQDNGGGVFERIRSRNIVVGYGRPAFESEPVPVEHGSVASEEELEMAVVLARPQGGYIVVQHDGGVFAYDGAPFCGSIPQTPNVRLGGNVVGAAWTESGAGYWLIARDGAIYAYGDAQHVGAFNIEPPEVRGSRYTVGMIRTAAKAYRIITFDPSGDDTRYDSYEYAA
jgi:hypothetical protein